MSEVHAYKIRSRWHLHAKGNETLCGLFLLELVGEHLPPLPMRPARTVPESRRCRTCWGVVEIIVALADANMEIRSHD